MVEGKEAELVSKKVESGVSASWTLSSSEAESDERLDTASHCERESVEVESDGLDRRSVASKSFRDRA